MVISVLLVFEVMVFEIDIFYVNNLQLLLLDTQAYILTSFSKQSDLFCQLSCQYIYATSYSPLSSSTQDYFLSPKVLIVKTMFNPLLRNLEKPRLVRLRLNNSKLSRGVPTQLIFLSIPNNVASLDKTVISFQDYSVNCCKHVHHSRCLLCQNAATFTRRPCSTTLGIFLNTS